MSIDDDLPDIQPIVSPKIDEISKGMIRIHYVKKIISFVFFSLSLIKIQL